MPAIGKDPPPVDWSARDRKRDEQVRSQQGPPPKELDIVVVTTVTGIEFKGILREYEVGRFMVLTSCSHAMEGPNGEAGWKELVGEVVIPDRNIDYFQRAMPAEILSKIGVL